MTGLNVYSCSEADSGMFSIFRRTGATTQRKPPRV